MSQKNRGQWPPPCGHPGCEHSRTPGSWLCAYHQEKLDEQEETDG